ncbi:MAG: cellulase family glycosylhydrolase [Candidatus Izimaplasma sp.]|nr:cellulase family glycosylhydrolase [Candidatus Izimaplasma bacterium]
MKKIRSVNLGGWFVLERWIKPSLFEMNNIIGKDETKFSHQAERKEEVLYEHYKTWITREDIVWLKEQGVNQVRIPIPWWLYGNGEYVRSIKHLDDALDMISDVGMDFILDLHTAPGCQNGFDNGGIEGLISWHKDEKNIEKTIEILEMIASRYKKYPHFFGIQLLNEPHWTIELELIQKFYLDAYHRLRKIIPEKWIIMCNSFRLNAWKDFFIKNKFYKVILDAHLYQCFGDYHLNFTIDEHAKSAIGRYKILDAIEQYVPVIVGEWSLGIRSNGTINNHNIVDVMKIYANAQLQGMSGCTGHIFWTYKTEDYNSPWNFRGLVERGVIDMKEFLK